MLGVGNTLAALGGGWWAKEIGWRREVWEVQEVAGRQSLYSRGETSGKYSTRTCGTLRVHGPQQKNSFGPFLLRTAGGKYASQGPNSPVLLVGQPDNTGAGIVVAGYLPAPSPAANEVHSGLRPKLVTQA